MVIGQSLGERRSANRKGGGARDRNEVETGHRTEYNADRQLDQGAAEGGTRGALPDDLTYDTWRGVRRGARRMARSGTSGRLVRPKQEVVGMPVKAGSQHQLGLRQHQPDDGKGPEPAAPTHDLLALVLHTLEQTAAKRPNATPYVIDKPTPYRRVGQDISARDIAARDQWGVARFLARSP